MQLRKDYEKELRVQTALGTLSRYKVSRPIGESEEICELFRLSEGVWFLCRVIINAVNKAHAIDKVMNGCNFSEDARKYLSAERIGDC